MDRRGRKKGEGGLQRRCVQGRTERRCGRRRWVLAWRCCCVRLEEEDGESGSASDGDEGDPEELVREKKMMGKGVLSG
ncbi:hypothetical protein MRB53_016147 [Persea americana]|uniref:Uncharacterized protein n=2 Tax=Persea americana TaxID=3435 RepID=A0ACC2M2N6_PERAE|nr:hypothetical protein MRB53_016146 [Persea americana]KAJ8639453.1 hypothetical protein MRB53_016147 [Persea americana]